jgi:hypothetical protein
MIIIAMDAFYKRDVIMEEVMLAYEIPEEYLYDITDEELKNAIRIVRSGYYGDIKLIDLLWDGRMPMYVYTCVPGLHIDMSRIDRSEARLRISKFNCILHIGCDKAVKQYEGIEVKKIPLDNYRSFKCLKDIIPILFAWLNAGMKVLISSSIAIDVSAIVMCFYAVLVNKLPITTVFKELTRNISPFNNTTYFSVAVSLMIRIEKNDNIALTEREMASYINEQESINAIYSQPLTEQEISTAITAIHLGFYGDINNILNNNSEFDEIYTHITGLYIDMTHICRDMERLKNKEFDCVLNLGCEELIKCEEIEVVNIPVSINDPITKHLVEAVSTLHKWMGSGKKVIITSTTTTDRSAIIACAYIASLRLISIETILAALTIEKSPFTNIDAVHIAVALMNRM